MERVRGQHVLEVGHQQLLVLLLVVQAEHDQRRDALEQLVVGGLEQVEHVLVDVGAVAVDVGDRRARDQAALGAAVPFADGVVVRVEQVRVLRVERLVAGHVRARE